MATAHLAAEGSSAPWRGPEEAARRAAVEARYFDAVQHINSALEAFGGHVLAGQAAQQEALIAEPARFAGGAGAGMGADERTVLADLYATRADVLMNLGGLGRANSELQAAMALVPGHGRAESLLEECQYLAEAAVRAPETGTPGAQVKVPVHILTGFLGSGKTTLLNHILGELHGRRLAVVENEYGEVGIDDALIAGREELGEERIVEMNNGCICCTVRGDLIRGLRSILQRADEQGRPLDGVIIETTGLADPAPVAQTFFADDFIQARMVLDGIITVVDAKHALQHLREEKPEGVENEAVEQVAFADRVLLNKTDLVGPEVLELVEAEIRRINAPVRIIRTERARVPHREVIGIRGFSLDRVLAADGEFLRDGQDHRHDQTVGSVGVECGGECDLERLNRWISALLKDRGADIFRMKGIIAVAGCADKFVFQGIHMIFSGQPQGPWGDGERRVNRLVFIGRNLNREELIQGFRSTIPETSRTADESNRM